MHNMLEWLLGTVAGTVCGVALTQFVLECRRMRSTAEGVALTQFVRECFRMRSTADTSPIKADSMRQAYLLGAKHGRELAERVAVRDEYNRGFNDGFSAGQAATARVLP